MRSIRFYYNKNIFNWEESFYEKLQRKSTRLGALIYSGFRAVMVEDMMY